MATQRRPKGSYIRPTPDWFIDRCAIGGLNRWSAVNKAASVGLYNNATDGSSLHVYSIWYDNDGVGAVDVTREQGTDGTLVGPCTPVVVGAGALPGTLWYRDLPGTSSSPFPTNFVELLYIALGDESAQQNAVQTAGPLCVLLPGYTLWVSQFFNNGPTNPTNLQVSFYYAALRDVG